MKIFVSLITFFNNRVREIAVQLCKLKEIGVKEPIPFLRTLC